MDESTRRAIVAEIAAAIVVPTKQDYQFTTEDVMLQCPGYSRPQVYSLLRQRVLTGALQSAMVHYNNRQVRVFWRPEDVPG